MFQAGKMPVVMPRRKEYGEHIDDHQSELVNALIKEKRVIAAFETHDLKDAVEEARNQLRNVMPVKQPLMFEILKKTVQELTGETLG